MATILDGKVVAAKIRAEVAAEVAALQAGHGVKPTLAVVLVGDDPASQVYVRNKRRACQEVGIEARDHVFPEGLTEASLLALVRELNAAPDVHGILVQLPIPGGIDESRVLDAVDPAKDVDGFHPENLGRLLAGQPRGRARARRRGSWPSSSTTALPCAAAWPRWSGGRASWASPWPSSSSRRTPP